MHCGRVCDMCGDTAATANANHKRPFAITNDRAAPARFAGTRCSCVCVGIAVVAAVWLRLCVRGGWGDRRQICRSCRCRRPRDWIKMFGEIEGGRGGSDTLQRHCKRLRARARGKDEENAAVWPMTHDVIKYYSPR